MPWWAWLGGVLGGSVVITQVLSRAKSERVPFSGCL